MCVVERSVCVCVCLNELLDRSENVLSSSASFLSLSFSLSDDNDDDLLLGGLANISPSDNPTWLSTVIYSLKIEYIFFLKKNRKLTRRLEFDCVNVLIIL